MVGAATPSLDRSCRGTLNETMAKRITRALNLHKPKQRGSLTMCDTAKLLGSYSVIDGCGVPDSLLRIVKSQANETHKIQCIGVVLPAPQNLKAAGSGDPVEGWARAETVGARMRTGTGCAYILGYDRDALRLHFHSQLAMILWITPD